LSTDIAAANSTGAAAAGEVEDYCVTIAAPSGGTIDESKTRTIRNDMGGPAIDDDDPFGSAVAAIGDLDGDGILDLAAGGPGESTGGTWRGATYVLFMATDGTVREYQKIASGIGGGPSLADFDQFGSAIASLGDLDGDGVNDIAVGAVGDGTGSGLGSSHGAIHVLFMNADGTVKGSQKIANGVGGGPTLANFDKFGSAITAMGDMDGDGLTDIAVGAYGDDTGGPIHANFGAVYVLFLNADGTAKSYQKIGHGVGGGTIIYYGTHFGRSLASIGDLNGDGVTDLAVGAPERDTSFGSAGSVHVLLMNRNGTAQSSHLISYGAGGIQLRDDDAFGSSVVSLGDLDADGVTEIAVGAMGDDTGGSIGSDRGAVYVLFMNADGTAKLGKKFASDLADPDWPYRFGRSMTPVGDLDGDGVPDLSVGSWRDDADSYNHGQLHTLFLQRPNFFAPQFTSPATVSVPENTTTVMTVTASDADVPAQPVTFSIVGGEDRTRFEITSSGVLSFTVPRDFEAPVDIERDNVYVVTIEANDGHGGAATQTVSVSVTNVGDPPSVDFGDAPDPGAGTGSGNFSRIHWPTSC
jgi:hypothetical protein